MAKPHITRTVGPIHFEDLDPHRFEDLVRQLAYDFRPWKSIESTGRGGADDGFDVRAFEEARVPATVMDDEADAEEVGRMMVEALTDHPQITQKVPISAEAKIVRRWSEAKDPEYVPEFARVDA